MRVIAVLALVGILPTSARADERMTADMERYFGGEKEEGWVFLGIGTASLATGAILLTRDDDVARGAAVAVLPFGVIEALVGAVLLVRTDGQMRDRRTRISEEPASFQREELARIEGVDRSFVWLFWSELTLVAGGVATAVIAALTDHPTWEGIGIGVAAQSAVLLTLDLFAAARADRYTEALRDFGRRL